MRLCELLGGGGGGGKYVFVCKACGKLGGSSFSGFSVGCCINREKVICYQLEFGK